MRRLAGLAVLVALAVGCDSGPSGPGDVIASIRSPNVALGGAVLEIVAAGVESFSGAGGTKVFWAPQDDPVLFRVIVIGEGGELNFHISVKDRATRTPRASLVSLVDLNNQPISVTKDHEVKFTK